MPTVTLDWTPAPPEDAADWERVIRESYTASGRELFVHLGQRDGGWRIEDARETPIVRTAKMAVHSARHEIKPSGDDWRDRLMRVLRENGKRVVD